MRRIIYHEIGSYRQLLADPAIARYAAWDARIRYAKNDSGELSITIAADNPEYAALTTMISEIVVEDNGIEMWRGRLIEPARDFYGRLTLVAKGVLDYLHDTVLTAQTLSGSASDIFAALIAQHNAKPIESRKKFTVGTVSMDATVDEITVSAGDQTWDIVAKLVKLCGGLISTHRVDGKNVIDWVPEGTHTCTQAIQLGSNLLDCKWSHNPDDLATVLYAYGKVTDDVALGIDEVNDGLPYVLDADAVALFGWIEGTYKDRSCEDASALKTAAQAELAERLASVSTVSLQAIDLSDISDAERIEIGYLVPVLIPPHNVDEEMPCTALERYLFEPTKTKITLGASMRAVSAVIGGLYDI